MAARITGRRPMWSDSEPMLSSVASTNSTLMANTAVSVAEENPHSAW
jgi:hypothetical protein